MKSYVLGIDLGKNLGVCKLYADGTIEAKTIKLQSDLASRVMGIERVIKDLGPECAMVGIEDPFGANPNGAKPLYAMMGAAVSACERFCVPWQLIHLAKIKKEATGRGNASKDEMMAAAKSRWDVDLDENAADAAWVANYVSTGVKF